uniref:N-alpha-acetyltransferase 40 n=1 Tax=Gallus gallus TaxID=9031 RepID=A0A8V0X7Y7_CHICK
MGGARLCAGAVYPVGRSVAPSPLYIRRAPGGALAVGRAPPRREELQLWGGSRAKRRRRSRSAWRSARPWLLCVPRWRLPTNLNVSIECKRVASLERATVDWAFELTKTNMQTLYEQSEWGWKDREKRDELTDERAWFLIAREPSARPVAFSHFRFDVECGDEVLYCYEVQLESQVRRRGLGKFLLQILQLVANSTQMKKVMLTVFKHNHGAYQFFREALQFDIDDSSPSVSGCCGDDCSYEVLSRRTKFGDGHQLPAAGHCGTCCH